MLLLFWFLHFCHLSTCEANRLSILLTWHVKSTDEREKSMRKDHHTPPPPFFYLQRSLSSHLCLPLARIVAHLTTAPALRLPIPTHSFLSPPHSGGVGPQPRLPTRSQPLRLTNQPPTFLPGVLVGAPPCMTRWSSSGRSLRVLRLIMISHLIGSLMTRFNNTIGKH